MAVSIAVIQRLVLVIVFVHAVTAHQANLLAMPLKGSADGVDVILKSREFNQVGVWSCP